MINLTEQNDKYKFDFSGGIYGDYSPGQETAHMYVLIGTDKNADQVLMDLKKPINRLDEIVFESKGDETLEVAIKRVLLTEFGLSECFRLDYKIPESNLEIIKVRAVCRNTSLAGKIFRDLNLFWYQNS